MSRVRIKMCGMTRPEDALAAAEAGADAIGMIFWAGSPRAVDVERAREIVSVLPPFVTAVGVFVDEDGREVDRIAAEVPLDVVQLHGEESPEYCASRRVRVMKAFRVRDGKSLEGMDRYAGTVSAFLLDAWDPERPGGTGIAFDWTLARGRGRVPLVLAGGLTPGNVAEAIRTARPWGVDVSSGIESAPGVKDHGLLREFVRRCLKT